MGSNKVFTQLRGRLSVVTGASSGIGLAYCRLIAANGGNLLMISNQPDQLAHQAKVIIDDFGVEAHTLCMNLAYDNAAERVMDTLDSTGSHPLLLINNAGIFDFATVDSLGGNRIDLYINLHMRTVTHLCRLMGQRMAREGEGYILNMSSMSCWMAMPGIAMYAATKAYIHTFSRALRVELLDSGVSVTVACPGGISTELFGLAPKLRRLGVALGVLATPESFVRKALRRTLKGRAQYINGLLNRISIVAVASLPEWARLLGKHELIDK